MNKKIICETCYNKVLCKYTDEVLSIEEKLEAIKYDANGIKCDAAIIDVSLRCKHHIPSNASFTHPRN